MAMKSNLKKRLPSRLLKEPLAEDKFEDLFVFGYAAKLFDGNDERSRYVDQGKHLIPWMGDASLLVDRYDVRGHLTDLTAFENNDRNGWVSRMTDKERALEDACDQERYAELREDIHDKSTFEEEEIKRFQVGRYYRLQIQ